MDKIYNIVSIDPDIFEFNESLSKDNSDKIDINLSLSIGVSSFDKKKVGFKPEILLSFNSNTLLKCSVSVVFAIESGYWDNSASKDRTRIVFPIDFAIELFDISLNILRGVVSEKTSGDGGVSFIIPIMNTDNLIQKDVVVDLE